MFFFYLSLSLSPATWIQSDADDNDDGHIDVEVI